MTVVTGIVGVIAGICTALVVLGLGKGIAEGLGLRSGVIIVIAGLANLYFAVVAGLLVYRLIA